MYKVHNACCVCAIRISQWEMICSKRNHTWISCKKKFHMTEKSMILFGMLHPWTWTVFALKYPKNITTALHVFIDITDKFHYGNFQGSDSVFGGFLQSNTSLKHYSEFIMGIMASQIISLSIVYSTVCSGTDHRKHQNSASLAFVRGIHRGPVNSPHKRPVTRKMSPFDDVIMQIPQYLEVYWTLK